MCHLEDRTHDHARSEMKDAKSDNYLIPSIVCYPNRESDQYREIDQFGSDKFDDLQCWIVPLILGNALSIELDQLSNVGNEFRKCHESVKKIGVQELEPMDLMERSMFA